PRPRQGTVGGDQIIVKLVPGGGDVEVHPVLARHDAVHRSAVRGVTERLRKPPTRDVHDLDPKGIFNKGFRSIGRQGEVHGTPTEEIDLPRRVDDLTGRQQAFAPNLLGQTEGWRRDFLHAVETQRVASRERDEVIGGWAADILPAAARKVSRGFNLKRTVALDPT